MHCDEFRDGMRAFLDGNVSGAQRRAIGRHLVECPSCGAAIEDARFWDDAIRRHLDHELPPDLRAEILGEAATNSATEREPAAFTGRQQAKIAWWAIKRDFRRPREMAATVVVAAAAILLLAFLPRVFHEESRPEAFRVPGPIYSAGGTEPSTVGALAPTARLSLSGRLI